MLKRNLLILTFFLIAQSHISAQYNEFGLSISLSYNYTTTSKLFPTPKASDFYDRLFNQRLENIYNFSTDVRYRLSDLIAVGINAEYIKKTKFLRNVVLSTSSGAKKIVVNDGFFIIPVELNLIYLLPFSTETLKFYMAGGAGFYFGSHIREFGNAELDSEPENLAFGIQVSTGMEYMIFDYLSVRFDMKFRDPEVEFKSTYKDQSIIYEGESAIIANSEFYSKVNIDGLTFGLGMVFHL